MPNYSLSGTAYATCSLRHNGTNGPPVSGNALATGRHRFLELPYAKRRFSLKADP